jgi:hypothetical protein
MEPRWLLEYPVDQILSCLIAPEVFQEVPDQSFILSAVAAGDVWSDETSGLCAQWVVRRQGFGVRDVEPCGGEFPGFQGGAEVVLIDGGAAPDVVEDGTGFEFFE